LYFKLRGGLFICFYSIGASSSFPESESADRFSTEESLSISILLEQLFGAAITSFFADFYWNSSLDFALITRFFMNLFDYEPPKLGVMSKIFGLFDLELVLSTLKICLRVPELLGEMDYISVYVILFSISFFESLNFSF